MTEKKPTRQRINLISQVECDLCKEILFPGGTAWYLPETGKHIHYGKCKGVQRKEDIQKAMKRIGLTEDVLISIDRIVEYMHREELKDYESRDEGEAREGHIYLDVKRLMEFKAGLS